MLLALPLAAADEGGLTAGPFALHGEAALGARAWVLVGDEADTTRYDPVATEGVGVSPLALEGLAQTEGGVYALLRLEEGVIHAGAVEAAEARLGWAAPGGQGELWLGRGDLPVTRDRGREPEDQALGLAPILSRTLLPWHATGAAGALAWPERATLQAGLAWTTASADAPWTWGRLDLHPLGPVPDDERVNSVTPTFVLGGGLARLDSPSLGQSLLWTADGELRLGPLLLGGGWTGTEQGEGEERSSRRAVHAQAGGGLLTVRNITLHAMLRGERATGIEAGEDARWLGAGRLSLSAHEAALEGYAELLLCRERGDGVEAGEDVVALGRGVERQNDALSLGLRARFR